jgi:hypothetical protein
LIQTSRHKRNTKQAFQPSVRRRPKTIIAGGQTPFSCFVTVEAIPSPAGGNIDMLPFGLSTNAGILYSP